MYVPFFSSLWFIFNLFFYILALSHRLCLYLNSEYTYLCTNDYVYFSLDSTLFSYRLHLYGEQRARTRAFASALRFIHIRHRYSMFSAVISAQHTNANRSTFRQSLFIQMKAHASPIQYVLRFYRQFVFDVVVFAAAFRFIFFRSLFIFDCYLSQLHFIAHLFIYSSD